MIIQHPEFLLLLPLTLLAARELVKGSEYGRKIAFTRTLIIVTVVLGAASPAITQLEKTSIQQNLNILRDNTTSTKVFKEIDGSVKGEETVFASGNSSDIFYLAAQNLEKNSYNLLISDGQTEENVKTLVQAARRKNATISVYFPETRKEKAVKIKGPSSTVPGAQNSFKVKISSTEEAPTQLKVKLDGKSIFSGAVNSSYEFNLKFDSKSVHTLSARINSSDTFQRNDRYYKTVEVREKPWILSVGNSGILEDKLKDFYRVENRKTLPENLEKYYAVLMKKPVESRRLKNYLVNGNGLVYTGEMKEKVPGYLPVIESSKEDKKAGARVILLIDASKSSGGCKEMNRFVDPATGEIEVECADRRKETKVKESLRIAYSLVDGLSGNNFVGAVAYNDQAYLVSRPKSLSSSRSQIKSKISRISPEGPSFHDLGLKGAASLARENDTVVMLSDGKIGLYNRKNIASKTRRVAANMEAKLITVGMGEDPNKPLLKSIAESTGGYYLENSEAGRLKFRFGRGGGTSKYTPIKVVNPNHFITEGLELDSTVPGFKPVDTLSTARKLVTGSNGEDFLSTWRYGLGRVAAFSAGKENLERVVSSDPELVSRTFAWAVGNPRRKKEKWIEVKDASRPGKPEVKSSYRIKGLEKQSDNLYTAELSPSSLGLHKWKGELYAYNYNTEISSVGLDRDKLRKIAYKTGGKVFENSEIGQVSDQVEEKSRRIEKQVSLAPYLLGLALILFLIEVGYRKRKGRI